MGEPTSQYEQPEWLDMKALKQYACVSERTIHEWIHLPNNPLPASQVGRKLLFRRWTFDRWLESHPLKSIESLEIDRIVEDLLFEFKRGS